MDRPGSHEGLPRCHSSGLGGKNTGVEQVPGRQALLEAVEKQTRVRPVSARDHTTGVG